MSSDPVMLAWMVKRCKNGRKIWTRIGSVYPHERGSGLTVALEVAPLDGRIYLFELNDKDDRRMMAEFARPNDAAPKGANSKSGRGKSR